MGMYDKEYRLSYKFNTADGSVTITPRPGFVEIHIERDDRAVTTSLTNEQWRAAEYDIYLTEPEIVEEKETTNG